MASSTSENHTGMKEFVAFDHINNANTARMNATILAKLVTNKTARRGERSGRVASSAERIARPPSNGNAGRRLANHNTQLIQQVNFAPIRNQLAFGGSSKSFGASGCNRPATFPLSCIPTTTAAIKHS